MYRPSIAGALACAILVAGCGDSGPEGPKATQMSLSSNSGVTWKNLCKRITINFADDSGAPFAYGRTDGLAVAATGAQIYGTSTCTGDPISSVLGAPDN